MLGFGVKSILGAMFGGDSVPVNVVGSRSDVASFTKTIGREKKYMDSIRKFGLDNPKTFKNKSKLTSAISDVHQKNRIEMAL